MTRVGDDGTEVRFELPGDRADVVLSWAALSDVGRRRHANEDSVIVAPPIFAVADGMGGHAAGDRASDAVVTRLAELANRGPSDGVDAVAVGTALAEAARDIDAIAENIPVGVGTTVTGVLLELDGPSFEVFNVGDSRVYRFLGGVLDQITVDHSVVQELVDAGVIAAEDAENHPESNVITRALGFREAPRIDVWNLPLTSGMRVLICSDGLTKEVGSAALRAELGRGTPAVETAEALVAAALEAGGRDNVTVVVIDVVAAPEPHPDGDSDPS